MELLKSYLTADFFTHSYRISGQMDTGHKRLSEMLNDELTSYLELRKAFVSRISRPGEIIATHTVSALRKDGILFAVLAAQEQRVTNRATYSFFSKRRYDVFLTVPSFEIKGYLEMTGKLDLKTVLVMKGTFLSLNEGEARASSLAEISFSGEEILVNQSWIGLFCITEAAS
jgi:hypothetical protein